MTPSSIDLLYLTFNCAKNLLDVPVFGSHLQTAFRQNATGLPEVVVLSLQEVAPLAYSFIGGYFLNPYLSRYEQAINIAAQHIIDDLSSRDSETVNTAPTALPSKPYTLVRGKNVGYTAILLFAREPSRLKNIQEAEVGFGAAEIGNKGAVGLRMLYEVDGGSSELTFVATHLAAMEWNLPRRNANWAAIMRGMAFENPEVVVNSYKTSVTPSPASTPPAEDEPERARLLDNEHNEQHLQLQQQLHNISVFRPSSFLFVAGDLNYRISTTSPPPSATFPSLDPDSENYYPDFFRLDQLTRERNAGRTLHGLSEHEVRFPPTYKYDVLPPRPGTREPELDVPWKFAVHRYPSWTDRILFLDVPSWLKKGNSQDPKLNVRAYDCLPVLRMSDHRPVYLRIDVPLISPSDMAPPSDLDCGVSKDPRARLPMEIDPEAWERRAAARRKEVMAGWSMYLWSTKEGACILATVLAFGAGVYWLHRRF
ncbi:phosphatidylinositol phosphate phosphatase [Fusarium tjaetaba]|uniref:Phosphatidylinositol phosphate phosphatase n=1 Tax=Fusarium tjaetaba TaxID=1567544 RepID=A0A8H5RNN3_9HYPO|nr:phosphatidylinositol phosphate phosphatase [Fusarium tjaetaba]KAF5636323.1 phosphatidylinositol phosphate phosphatase [Fusarium tjaetaba]